MAQHISIPSFLKPLVVGVLDGVIRQRILHVPDSEVKDDAEAAGVSVAQWRAVESQQASKIDDHLANL